MRVVALWRYPIKAMLGESLAEIDIGSAGPAGDRRWVVVDAQSGKRIANRRGRTDPRLRACRAELAPSGEASGPLTPRVTLPDGTVLTGGRLEDGLSELLDRRVCLERAESRDGRLGAPGGHQDFAPVHIIVSETLRYLRSIAPDSDWDARRFRPNVLLEDSHGGERFAEDRLIGGRLRARSGLELTVGVPTLRCVVPTRASEELPADPSILRTLDARHPVDLGPLGHSGCVGAYAEVLAAGALAVGDDLEDASAHREGDRERLEETIARALAARSG